MKKGGLFVSAGLFALFLVLLLPVQALEKNSVWKQDRSAFNDNQSAYALDHILIKKKSGEIIRQSVADNQTVSEAIEWWRSQGDVEYAEPDGLIHVYGEQTSWGYDTIQAAAAQTTNGANGSGIIVAVIDTGVDYEHEDLDANNWVNSGEIAGNSIDDDGNGYIDDVYGYDFIGSFYTSIDPDNDPQDEYGHGTHVSGIVAAEDNDVGVVGVAPNAVIMPVKVLDSNGTGFDSNLADGIRYAVDNGANVINMSLGGYLASNTLKDAVDYALTNNVVVVASAGNSAMYTYPSYPASYNGVISVGATTEDGTMAYFSNWGKVDVVAPGYEILSSTPYNNYEKYSGTSMAAPHVCGTLALIMQKHGITSSVAAKNILLTTTDDFSSISGPDYLSGQGEINAYNATGTLTSSIAITADAGFIIANDDDSVNLTVSVRNNTGLPVVGENITWSVDKGTLSASSSTTDANGQTIISITAQSVTGLSTITAASVNAGSANLQLAVVDDVVRPVNIGVTEYGAYSDDIDDIYDDEEGDGELVTTGLSLNQLDPADQLIVWAYAEAYDRETHKTTMSYQVLDPNGEAVADLSGSSEEIEVGSSVWYWYVAQTKIVSKPLTIPQDAVAGEYTLNITITDNESGETATRSANFWVGALPEILLVDNQGGCMDTTVEALDFGALPVCSSAGHMLADEIKQLGYEVIVWNTNDGFPQDTDLKQFPLVIWADAGIAWTDSYTLQSYLDAGGNLLLTSDSFASFEFSSIPSDFLWNYLHARGISYLMEPETVLGTASGPFTGLSFDTNYFNLNGNGAHNGYYADELELNDADGAEAIMQYTQGDSTDKTAAIRVDNGIYRSVYLGFGLESINDASGNATKSYVLSNLINWLLGDDVAVTGATPNQLKNNQDRTITVNGENFQMTGTTQVKLGETELSEVVVTDRNTISATIPVGFTAGTYDLTVINPDTSSVTLADAVEISGGSPGILSASSMFVANHKKQTVTLYGSNFKKKTKIFLGKKRIKNTKFISDSELEIMIPKDYKVGSYKVKAKNGKNKIGKMADKFKVRYGFTEDLKEGDSGEAVKYLEKRLKTYGYLAVADTQFDAEAAEALAIYQQSLYLNATGSLNYITRYYLNTVE